MKKYIPILILLSILLSILLYIYYPVNENRMVSEEFELRSLSSNNPYTLYRHYSAIERYPTDDYAVYVFDEDDDEYLHEYAVNILDDLSPEVFYDDRERVNALAFYAQTIIYEEDPDGEYPKFPIETLQDGTGDCEDKAILGASLINIVGYKTALVSLANASHMVVAVDIGNGYEYLEMSDTICRLGQGNFDEDDTFFELEPRPLIYHEWDDLVTENSILKKYVMGKINVFNRGPVVANSVLKIGDEKKEIVISPFSKVVVDIKIKVDNVEEFKTELYLFASLVEVKEVETEG